MRVWLLPLLAALALPAAAGPSVLPSLDVQLAANMARGDELYAYDQSAWHVTDAALAAIPKATKKLLRGYVTTPTEGGHRTTFYGGEAGSHFRIYSAVWTGNAIARPELYAPDSKTPVTAEEDRLIAAREVAIRGVAGLVMCSDASPNVAAISGATPNSPISVYIMTPPAKYGVLPMGGHHRLDIVDGAVVAKRAFTKSCINLELPRSDRKGKKLVALVVTHLLDPIPTEIHAFSVHASGLPLAVGTADGSTYWIGLRAGKAFAQKDK